MKLVSVVLLLLGPVLTGCFGLFLPLDCSDIYCHDNSQPSGVFTIYPIGATSAVQVYCDMESDGGRWTVFQRRMDGSVNFYRPWDQYKKGFGSAAGEYWLGSDGAGNEAEITGRGETPGDQIEIEEERGGNERGPTENEETEKDEIGDEETGLENLYHLSQRKRLELQVDMEDFSGNKVFARYSSFSIDPESNGYTLKVSGFTDGGAGDSLSYHNGQKFSTFDKDQDQTSGNCARSYLGAFWYNVCHHANPNGVYRWGADGTIFAVGVEWKTWKGHDYSPKTISMKIRPLP